MANNKADDKMPDRFSEEFEAYADRLLRLPKRDFFELFEIVGVRFASNRGPGEHADFEELKDTPKYHLVEIFDEADSRQKVEDYLKSKGL